MSPAERHAFIKHLVEGVLARKSGASGTAVFVDPIVLEKIVECALDTVFGNTTTHVEIK